MRTKQFEITGVCNLKCEFCYNQSYMPEWQDMSRNTILEKAGRNNMIYIGGGEPLTYKGIEDLVKAILENENLVILSTNGIIYKELPKSERLQIQISLPTIDEQIYKKITKGYVKKVKNNILRYKKDYNIFINTPIYEENFSEIDGIARFCKENRLILRLSRAIPANGIKTIKEDKIRKKALELILDGTDLIYTLNGNEKIEYHTPGGRSIYPFKN